MIEDGRITAIAAAAALVLLSCALPAYAQSLSTVMGDTMTYRGAGTATPKMEATGHVAVEDVGLANPPGSPSTRRP